MLETTERRTWRHADPAMLIITLLLIGFGLVTIYSADGQALSLGSAAFKQGLFAAIGLALMAGLAAFDYRFLRGLAVPLYGLGLGLLALVLKKGIIIAGAQRWFNLGFTTFQPSEPAKMAMVVALAAFITARGPHIRGPFSFATTGIIAAVPALLVFIEPDLGTALVFIATWVGMIAVSRTRGLYLLSCLVAAVPLTWFFWQYIFHDYQKDRLLTFRHPEQHPDTGGFNIIQAKITIGQAGFLGHRFADSAQINEYQRLAVSTTDFAFAHAIGNFGFLGALAVFALYLLLIWRYLRVAHLARDEFGQLLAMGAAAMLLFQAFVNIGMNVNLLPVVGIPLPFISAGGTPLITMLAMQGILQSVLMHRQRLAFGTR